jgi:hypothetical protein
MNCKHCGQPIVYVEDYIWVHRSRRATLTGDLCEPDKGFGNSTLAEPKEDG